MKQQSHQWVASDITAPKGIQYRSLRRRIRRGMETATTAPAKIRWNFLVIATPDVREIIESRAEMTVSTDTFVSGYNR